MKESNHTMPELKESRTPLYRQLMEVLRTKIDEGAYAAGERIPSEFELAEQYGVSRITVRRAVTELCHAGYLSKQQGKGTFVCERKVERKILRSDSMPFAAICTSSGRESDARVISLERVDPHDDERTFFGIADGEPLFCLTRVHTADGVPIAIENSYFPCCGRESLVREDFERVTLPKVIAQDSTSRLAEEPITTLEATTSTSIQAKLLNIAPGDPLFYIHTYLVDEQGKPLCVGRHVIAGSRFMFTV